MKYPERELHDIYQENSSVTKVPEPPETLQKTIRRQRVRQLFFGGLALCSVIGLIILLAASLLSEYRITRTQQKTQPLKSSFISVHSLPAEEQWAAEYRVAEIEAEVVSRKTGSGTISAKTIKNTAYHIIMGEQALRQQEWFGARKHFDRVLSAFPDMLNLKAPLGFVCLRQKDFPAAAEHLQLALQENRSASVLNNLGASLTALGSFNEAEPLLKEAARLRPDLAGPLKNLTLLYRQTGQTNAMLSAFSGYLTLNPADTPSLALYVQWLAESSRIPEAIVFLEQLSGGDPLEIQLLLARTSASTGDAEKSVQALRAASLRISSRQLISIMHEDVFKPVAQSDLFRALLREAELSAVTLSKPSGSGNKP